jgi:hypothetical protein
MGIIRDTRALAECGSRRQFIADAGRVLGGALVGSTLASRALSAMAAPTGEQRGGVVGRPRFSEFTFARLRYDSGDWDYNPKVCANLLDAVLQYTDIPVNDREIVSTADSAELPAFPFLFMTGHKLVRLSEAERQGLVRYVEHGGLLSMGDQHVDLRVKGKGATRPATPAPCRARVRDSSARRGSRTGLRPFSKPCSGSAARTRRRISRAAWRRSPPRSSNGWWIARGWR